MIQHWESKVLLTHFCIANFNELVSFAPYTLMSLLRARQGIRQSGSLDAKVPSDLEVTVTFND